MRTPWISFIINCSGITSSLTPLKPVQPRSARTSWKMLHQSGELLFTTPPWQTSRKLSMLSILHNPTFTKLGFNLVSGVIETGVPGERDTPTKLLRLPQTMKIIHPPNLWGYQTWKGMRTQIGKSFSTIGTSLPLRTPNVRTKKLEHSLLATRPGHERIKALHWSMLCLQVRKALAQRLPEERRV